MKLIFPSAWCEPSLKVIADIVQIRKLSKNSSDCGNIIEEVIPPHHFPGDPTDL